MNRGGAPERILVCRLLDQVDLSLRDLRSACFRPAFPSPEQPEALPVPANDGFRLEDQECLFPRTEDIGHDTEEDPIRRAQSGSRGRTSEYFELFSEEDDLQLKLNP